VYLLVDPWIKATEVSKTNIQTFPEAFIDNARLGNRRAIVVSLFLESFCMGGSIFVLEMLYTMFLTKFYKSAIKMTPT